MLLSRFNPPLSCVKVLNDKTLYAWTDSQPNFLTLKSPFGVSYFNVGSASALTLLGFLLTCRAYKTKFTAGGKL